VGVALERPHRPGLCAAFRKAALTAQGPQAGTAV
jgi:hypothetical protein